MRRNYWSCTKFADFLRGTDKPNAMTSEGWNDWRREAEKFRFRFWLAEEGLDKIQNFIYWPLDKIYDLKYYINNRWISKTHALTSNMKRGQWHEFDERVLHCLFDELVNYVEIQEAWNHIIWLSKEERKKYNPPWYSHGPFHLHIWRCPEAGIDHLEWASKLVKDLSWGYEDNHPEFGDPTPQAINAQKILELYRWWKEVYPNRPDPYEASGWNDFCNRRKKEKNHFSLRDVTSDEREETKKYLKLLDDMEKQYADEEESKLIELIKIRHNIWT